MWTPRTWCRPSPIAALTRCNNRDCCCNGRRSCRGRAGLEPRLIEDGVLKVRLQEAGRQSPLFSVERANLVSFWQGDHGPRDGSSLRDHVDRLLCEAGLSEPPARVLLLCYPRVLGYVFNPLSVYFAYDAADRLVALVYEVRVFVHAATPPRRLRDRRERQRYRGCRPGGARAIDVRCCGLRWGSRD